MKKTKPKINFKRLIYPVAVITFYALGAFACSVQFSPRILEGNYFFGIGQITLIGFVKGWLYHLIPFLVIFFSGYDYIGRWYTLTALGFRAYLSGYSGCSCVSARVFDKAFIGITVFTLFTLVESLMLIVLLSGAVEQDRFRRYYTVNHQTPSRSGVNKTYINHNFQRCGILVLVYLFRSVVCYLM